MDKTGRDGAGMRTLTSPHWKENIKNRDRKYNNTDLILVKITFFAPLSSTHWLTMLCTATVVGEECVKYWCWEIWNGSERNLKSQLWSVLQQMQDDVQKSDSHSQDSERKKVLASPNDSLACAFIDLGAFWSVVAHLPSENLVLPYFSSLSMVAVSVPFPEVRSRKGTESGLQLSKVFIIPMIEMLKRPK